MKFNDREIAKFSKLPADREGRLNHKAPGHREGYHERWFKLRGNLLFYYRLNEYGAVSDKEQPEGVFVLEKCKVQMENNPDSAFVFSIVFAGDQDKKHYFSGPTLHHCEQWVSYLTETSYESWRTKLGQLQNRLMFLTGKDPLEGYSHSFKFQAAKPSLQSKSTKRSALPKNNSVPTSIWLLDS